MVVGVAGAVPLPLPRRDVEDVARAICVDDDEHDDFVRCIRAMDAEWIAYARRQQAGEATPEVSTTPMTIARFDALFGVKRPEPKEE